MSYGIYLLVMAGVTYLVRAIPFAVFNKKIENRFFHSFLAYVPYAVLTAMTFPAIFYSTGSEVSAAAGTVVAVVLAYFGRGLLTVALCACGVVFLVGGIL